MNANIKKIMKSVRIAPAALTLVLTTQACGMIGFMEEKLNGNSRSFPVFPFSSAPPAPNGSDPVSSSTNFSKKAEDPKARAKGTTGAVFIKPPKPNNYGVVSISYPIEVAPGRAGMQPSLSLSYSSNGGDGWVGMGWSIGVGAISRTTSYGQLYYDKRDTFTYNGKRLLKVSGSTKNEEGVYRLEIESGFMKFELTDMENGGIWYVRDSSGTLHVYGETRDSRIHDPNQDTRTFSWKLTRSADRNGNFMEMEYDTGFYASNRVLYLKEIRYTGNTAAGMPARQYARFHLKKRSDSYVSKAPGFVMKTDRLLDRIEIGWDQGKLWEYKLVYETSPDSQRPVLKTVESDRTSTKPEFKYQPAVHTFAWRKILNRWSGDDEINPKNTKYFEGDFNGDGISDMVFFNPRTGEWKAVEGRAGGGYAFKIYGNKYRGYQGPEKIQWFKGNVSGDFNGDGRSDIAFYLPESREFIIAQHNGRVFEFRNYGKLTLTGIDIFKAEWFPGDFDGNGLSDSVLFDEPTGDWILMRNLGNRFEFTKFANKFRFAFRGDYSPDSNQNGLFSLDKSDQGLARDKIVFLSGDYNGDGRSDISFYDKRDGKWWVGENHRADPLGFRLEWKLYKVFNLSEQVLFGFDRFSGDFNGDGLSDFLVFNKEKGEWIIGETRQPTTGNPTINFRILSKTPQFKEITRWLQGDFNGDGRTDIGFFSATDNNFWIGEATNSGFRYRIYTNLAGGPDPDRVLKTPAPRDEVEPKSAKTAFSPVAGKTLVLDYTHDGNIHQDRGEIVFAGCFTGVECDTKPELLLFDRKSDRLNIKKGTATPALALDSLLLDHSSTVIRGGGRPVRNAVTNKDEIVYSTDVGSTRKYHAIAHAAGSYQNVLLGQLDMSGGPVTNFHKTNSVQLMDHFTTGNLKTVLLLDDQAATPRFVLLEASGHRALTINKPAELDFKNILRFGASGDNRDNRKEFSFFTGKFEAAATAPQVLMVDRRESPHKWYLGTLDTTANTITFVQKTATSGENVIPAAAGFDFGAGPPGIAYHLKREAGGYDSILYGYELDGGVNFMKFSANAAAITRALYNTTDANFKNEYDHAGDPLVRTADGVKRFVPGAGIKSLTPNTSYLSAKLERPDLMTKVYAFRWIQGDYNGDGKTDIGIFHIKEPVWYFANTTGTVPDMLHRIENGIGGTYLLQYANSTSFDNTGGDGIPDLPTNYKVCVRVETRDGQNNSAAVNYEYANGHAFSAFIDGRKETDYFGFGRFVARDAYGGKIISIYNNVPHADYRLNRALAGAIKESVAIGHDGKQYSRTLHDYQIHTINQGGVQSGDSYMITPAKVRKYSRGTLTETDTQSIGLAPGAYELLSRTTSTTDHYSDAAHASETVTSYSEFQTDGTSNQQRPTLERKFQGSAHELTTNFVYDGKGNRIRSTTSSTGSGLPAAPAVVMEYDFDAFGNITEERNVSTAPSRVTRRAYDTQLQQFTAQEKRLTDTGELVVNHTINYGSAFGRPAETQDANGNRTYSDYDSLGRLSAIRAETSSGTQTLQSFDYSTRFPVSAKTTFHTGSADPTVLFRVYTDGLGRHLHTVRSAADGRYVRTGRIVYDALGRVVRKGQSVFADASEIDTYKFSTALKNPTFTEYDGSGRVSKVTLPRAAGETAATTVTTTYNDPWEVTVLHSVGRGKRTTKNARGHTLKIEDFGTGDDNQALSAKIGFCYSIAGKAIKKMDTNSATLTCSGNGSSVPAKDVSGNNIVYWSYDAFGRLRGRSDPDLGVHTYQYNAFGDRTQTTDALNRTITMAYDRLGRMTGKTLPGGEGAVNLVYDDNAGSANSKGRLVMIDDPAQTKVLSYDKLGRLASEIRTVKGGDTPISDVSLQDASYTTVYKYDLLGRTLEIDYPKTPGMTAGMRACYSYDSFGYMKTISSRMDATAGSGCAGERMIVHDTEYNEFGQMTRASYGNGVTSLYTYDAKGRMARLQSIASLPDGSQKTVQDVNYTFDGANGIKAVANNADAYQTTYNYEYDGLNRLVNATGSYVESFDGTGTTQTTPSKFHRKYAYALNGNLLQKDFLNPDTGALDDRWNYTYVNHMAVRIDTQANGPGRFTMTYNDVGNMTGQADTNGNLQKDLYFNSRNRIDKVIDPVASRQMGRYWYDDGGFRVRKVAYQLRGTGPSRGYADVETIYPSKFFGIEILNGTHVVNNVYLNGLRIATIAENGGALWFLADQVDTVKTVLTDTAEVRNRMEHMPYGEVFVKKGDLDFQPKFNSQELDSETNYYFYNARYYDPQISRFVTADTVIDGEGTTAGWNRFAYTKGNPILYKDPTGHIICGGLCILGIVATGAAIGAAAGGISAYMNDRDAKGIAVGMAGGAFVGGGVALVGAVFTGYAATAAIFAVGTQGSILENGLLDAMNGEFNPERLLVNGAKDGAITAVGAKLFAPIARGISGRSPQAIAHSRVYGAANSNRMKYLYSMLGSDPARNARIHDLMLRQMTRQGNRMNKYLVTNFTRINIADHTVRGSAAINLVYSAGQDYLQDHSSTNAYPAYSAVRNSLFGSSSRPRTEAYNYIGSQLREIGIVLPSLAPESTRVRSNISRSSSAEMYTRDEYSFISEP